MHAPAPAPSQHSGAWISFTYAQLIASGALVFGGLAMLSLDLWIKGYFLMGIIMLVSSAITVTKTMRDQAEGAKLLSRIDEAKTEQLLMRIDRAA